nr:phosphotransferase [Aeromonas cavernicola]
MAQDPAVHALLTSLPPPWRDGTLTPIMAGLTNRNYRLRLPSGRSYFLRQGHPQPQRLGIDRATEWQLYEGAMAMGLAPPCHYQDPLADLLLLTWCDEPTWQQAPPPRPAQPALLASALLTLHRLPLPKVVMAVRAHAAAYRARLTAPPHWLPALERGVLASHEPNNDWRPCHHDLNPANLMGGRPWIIDWEYGAAGHPGFELASIQRTHGWQPNEREALEAHYLQAQPRHLRIPFQSEAFLPWVDYIALLWALLMAEQQPRCDYQQLIDSNRQRLE